MRIGFYNIENLFFRHREFMEEPAGKGAREWIREMDELICQGGDSGRVRERIEELSFLLGFSKIDPSHYAMLRTDGSDLYLKCFDKKELVGALKRRRHHWTRVLNRPIPNISREYKARVIAEANADILLIQEVEDRPSLDYFNKKYLGAYPIKKYSTLSILQNADERRIEQGLCLREPYRLLEIRDFSSSVASEQWAFSQGFTGYHLKERNGKSFWLLLLQMLRKEDSQIDSDQLGLEQSHFVASIFRNLEKENPRILVCGNFHEVSYSHSLVPLFESGLKNVYKFIKLRAQRDLGTGSEYHSLGAYQKGINLRQQNYILASPAFLEHIRCGGILRKGIWPGKHFQWDCYSSLKSNSDQASSNPLLWVDIAL